MCRKSQLQTDDGELVRRARAGDGEAFTVLVSRYRDMAYGTAYHYLGNAEEAQDAAQEALVAAYVHLRSLRDPNKFSPWLRRAVVNACADQRRRRLPALGWETGVMAERPLERLTMRLVVWEALSRLSEKTRLTVTLFYLGGYSHAEIARFLEIPVNTVRSRLQHAKRLLREEMQTMVSDTLHETKPDENWTRQVAEEALRRGEVALKSHQRDEAVRHYDAALSAIDTLSSNPERKRLKLETLRQRGNAIAYPRTETISLLREALTIAEEIDDRRAQGEIWRSLGDAHGSNQQPGEAQESYRQALRLFQGLGDALGQANSLLSLGMHSLFQHDVRAARGHIEQAVPLFAGAGSLDWLAVCEAIRDLLAEVKEANFPRLILWRAVCDTLEKTAETVRSIDQPGFQQTHHSDDVPDPLYVGSVFWQVSHLQTLLDMSLAVGAQWSGSAYSFSGQPLLATVSVKSTTERIVVPAGEFGGCLLTEQITTQGKALEAVSERGVRLNRLFLCGTVRAWYAPGVGLVQVQVRNEAGQDTHIHLQTYFVPEGGQDYLPLAIGNAWTYGWAIVPDEYIAKEHYRVAAHADNLWYLAHHAYVGHKSREG